MFFKYSHGYAIPEYIANEPSAHIPRGGTFTTKYMKRGTEDLLRPGSLDGFILSNPLVMAGLLIVGVIVMKKVK